jgi:O-antigen/teichoic acid export membrane protein
VILPLLGTLAPETRNLPYVHLLFCFYLANTCVSYLFSYKGLLASADQKNYIQLRNHYFFTVGLNLAQIFVIYFTKNFVAYAAVQSLFTISEGISLSVIMDKRYPLLKRKDKIALPRAVTHRIWSDVRKIVVGRVGGTIISSTDNLILANVVGLSTTGAYSNYVLIKSSLQAIVCQFQSAVSASIGNIAASGEREKELEYFWFLNFVTTALFSVTGVCMFNLMQPFIAYWLGGSYLMGKDVLFCLTAIYYFGGIRGNFGTFSMAHGIFDLEAKKAIAESLINLVVSIILGWKLGVVGVLLGTIVSSVFVGLPMELINVGLALPEISKRRYVAELSAYTGATVIVWFLSMRLCELVSMHWYIRLPLGFLITVAVFIVVWWLIFGRTKAFRKTVELGRGIIKNKLRWKNE